ncbi:MAG TPA: dual specificity protein phosphatase, partial [Anaerolineales bacterium]|nr:dual specificity protein phosphatase [Anaerolineales bacterium]
MTRQHSRIIQHPFAASLQGALLDSYEEEQRDEQLHIKLNIRALERSAPSELFERDGIIYERIQGNYVPAQLYFSGVAELKSSDFFKSIASLPRNDSARTIEDMLSWRQPERQDMFFLFGMHAPDALMFFAHRAMYESSPQESTPIILERDWCCAPPMPGRLVPRPKQLHSRFGGDPITIKINGNVRHHKLFIGGVEVQPKNRPQVDVVLNVGEEPSKWAKDSQTHSPDRWDNQGEGSEGMSIEVIREEAKWVIERLGKNQRVLVHCLAGMNRSSTICCAVLILLEGLSAEQALERVREHHPWARPDANHWLKLRWLAKSR